MLDFTAVGEMCRDVHSSPKRECPKEWAKIET
jgi:hypothetical protein